MESSSDVPPLASAVESASLRLRLVSRPDLIEPTVEYLRDHALRCGACLESQEAKLALVLHEALSNSLVHGNLDISSELKEQSDNAFAEMLAGRAADPRYADRSVQIAVDYDGDRTLWTLTDQGAGFDVEQVMARDPHSEEALLKPSGRGILLMRALLDEVRYEAGGRRVVLALNKPAGKESRRSKRVPLQKPLRLVPIRPDGSIDWQAATEAVSRNLSREGMAVLQGERAPGDRVLIAMTVEGETVYQAAEVCHFRPTPEGMIELGCRFQTRPSTPPVVPDADSVQAMTAVIERLQSSLVVRDERRAHPRQVFTGRISVLGKGGQEIAVGFARDLSKHGIAFVTSTPLPPAEYVLTLPQGGSAPQRVRARLVRCAKILEGFFDVGAYFLGLEPS